MIINLCNNTVVILQILKCINHLSTDPNCLENLQRADAIKYLIPNLELKEGSLVSQIHTEVDLPDLCSNNIMDGKAISCICCGSHLKLSV